MAYNFETTPTATVKGRSTTSTDEYSLKGINSSLTSATDTATEINKLLKVYGKSIAGDEHMKMTITKQAEEEE